MASARNYSPDGASFLVIMQLSVISKNTMPQTFTSLPAWSHITICLPFFGSQDTSSPLRPHFSQRVIGQALCRGVEFSLIFVKSITFCMSIVTLLDSICNYYITRVK